MINKSNISNLIKNFSFNIKLPTLATKAELKADQNKMLKLQTLDLIYFCGKFYFGNDGFQSMFVYQATLELKEDKDTDYAVC